MSGAILEESGLVGDHDPGGVGEMVQHVAAQVIPNRFGVPAIAFLITTCGSRSHCEAVALITIAPPARAEQATSGGRSGRAFRYG
jgi:hypothetical protein